MKNFDFHNPVRILFGKGQVAQIAKLIPRTARVMVIYGRGSVKRNGFYAQAKQALEGVHAIDFGGIGPNPDVEKLTLSTAFATLSRTKKCVFRLSISRRCSGDVMVSPSNAGPGRP